MSKLYPADFSKIAQFRAIVEDDKFGYVEGYSVDESSAAMVCKMYDGLSADHKLEFISYRPGTMVKLARSLLK